MIIASLTSFAEKKRTVIVVGEKAIAVNFTLEMVKLSEETTVEVERPLLSAAEKVSEVTLTPSQIEALPSLGGKKTSSGLSSSFPESAAANPSLGLRYSTSTTGKTSGTKSSMWWKARSSRTTSCTWD